MKSGKMLATPCVYISGINPALDQYKIKVRVIRLWRAFKSIEMILVDGEGTRIHASIEDGLVKKFQDQFVVGQSRIVDTFNLVDYDSDYRTNPLGFKISFYRTTVVKPCDDFPCQVPERYFVQFPDILSGALDKNVLFDVLGQIVSMGNLEDVKTKGKDNVKLTFELQDLEGVRLGCTIWSDLAKTVSAAFKNNMDPLVICVVRFACLKEWRGNYTISNAFHSTEILFNPSIPEVIGFKEMLPSNKIEIVRVEDEQQSGQPKITLYEEFFMINMKKSLDDIFYTSEVGTCVTIAKVRSVEVLPKWFYVACKACSKKVQPYPCDSQTGEVPRYSCGVCDADVTDVEYKYKLILRASYISSPEVKLLFFDGLAQRLVGGTAAELCGQIADEDPSVLPYQLSELVGKTLLFKISIGTDNLKSSKAAYVVEKFWEKQDMVEKFAKDLLGDNGNSRGEVDMKEEVPKILAIEEKTDTLKRVMQEKIEDPPAVHNMVTRKRIKTEKFT